MSYFAGALAGLVFGCLVAVGKYFFAAGRFKKAAESPSQQAISVYTTMFVNYFVNLASLLLIFLLRNVLPFDFTACIIAAAVALSVLYRILSAKLAKGGE